MIEKIYFDTKTESSNKMEHLYLKHRSNSNTLIAMFPGGNYSCDRPLFHYMRKMVIDKNCDVLCINYGDVFKGMKFGESLFDAMSFETSKALDYCLEMGSYSQIYLVGKSIGTPVIGRIKSNQSNENLKLIFLTPIEASIDYINKHKGLVITGTNDDLFTKDMIKTITECPETLLHVLNGANHGLELVGNINDTIDLHKEIMEICGDYIATGKLG